MMCQNNCLEVKFHEPFVWGDEYQISITTNLMCIHLLRNRKNEDKDYRIVLQDHEYQNIVTRFRDLILSTHNVEINSDGDRYDEPGAYLYIYLSEGHLSHTVELSGWSNHKVIHIFLNRIFEIIPKFKLIYDGKKTILEDITIVYDHGEYVSVFSSGNYYSYDIFHSDQLIKQHDSINASNVEEISFAGGLDLDEFFQSSKTDMLKSVICIFAYNCNVDYCDVLSFIIEEFGDIPPNFRITKEIHLAALYFGISHKDNFNATIIRGNESCKFDACDGLVEILDEYSEIDGSTIELDEGSLQEVIAGGYMVDRVNYETRNNGKLWRNVLLLDYFPYDIRYTTADDGKCYFLLFSGYTLPTIKKEKITIIHESFILWLKIGEKVFKCYSPFMLSMDDDIQLEIDHDCTGVPVFRLTTDNYHYTYTFTMKDLLFASRYDNDNN